MTIPDLTDAAAWPDEDLSALRVAVLTEQERRQTLASYPSMQAALYASARRADPAVTAPTDGQPYVEPTGYQDAYPAGTTVTYDGHTYRASQDGAWMQPDLENSGWVRIDPDADGTVPWVAPHAGEEYAIGALVTYQGHTWRNDLGGPNGFTPGTTGSGWTDLGPTA